MEAREDDRRRRTSRKDALPVSTVATDEEGVTGSSTPVVYLGRPDLTLKQKASIRRGRGERAAVAWRGVNGGRPTKVFLPVRCGGNEKSVT